MASMDILLLVALGVIALPLLGNLLAMTLGVWTALGRGTRTPRGPVAASLRRAAQSLGCWLESDPPRAPAVDTRTLADRREGERRASVRAQRSWSGAERRAGERRVRERRQRSAG